MARVTKEKSTSTVSTLGSSTQQNCVGCPRVSSSNSGSISEYDSGTLFMDTFTKHLVSINDLQKDVLRIEKEQDRTREFYSGITSLAKISKAAIFVLMLIPALQLIICAALVYYLGIQEQLSGLLNWVLGSVSVLSIIEIVFTAIKYFTLENKVNDLEKRVDGLQNGKK